jgi:hypothetical protein
MLGWRQVDLELENCHCFFVVYVSGRRVNITHGNQSEDRYILYATVLRKRVAGVASKNYLTSNPPCVFQFTLHNYNPHIGTIHEPQAAP